MDWTDTAAMAISEAAETSAYGLALDTPVTVATHYPGDRYVIRYDTFMDETDILGEDQDKANDFLVNHIDDIELIIGKLARLAKGARPEWCSWTMGFANGMYLTVIDYRPDFDDRSVMVIEMLQPLTNGRGNDTMLDGDVMKESKYNQFKDPSGFRKVDFRLRLDDLRTILWSTCDDNFFTGLSGPTAPTVSYIPRPHLTMRRDSLHHAHELLIWGHVGERGCPHGKPYSGGDMQRNGVIVFDHRYPYPECRVGVIRSLKGTHYDPDTETRSRTATGRVVLPKVSQAVGDVGSGTGLPGHDVLIDF